MTLALILNYAQYNSEFECAGIATRKTTAQYRIGNNRIVTFDTALRK